MPVLDKEVTPPNKRMRGDEDTFRPLTETTLGEGNAMHREAKAFVWSVYCAFRDKFIKINTQEVKESFSSARDRTAYLLEISDSSVKRVVTEANAYGGFHNPAQRGGQPWEKVDCGSHEAIAAIHRSVYQLQHQSPPVPVTVPKIIRQIAKENYRDDEGELLKLTPKMVNRLLHLTGYIYGTGKEHHVAKFNKGNLKYRKAYCTRVLEGREGDMFVPDGMPAVPEYFQ